MSELVEVIEDVLVDNCLKAGRDAACADAWAYRGESAVSTVDYLVNKYAELSQQNLPA